MNNKTQDNIIPKYIREIEKKTAEVFNGIEDILNRDFNDKSATEMNNLLKSLYGLRKNNPDIIKKYFSDEKTTDYMKEVAQWYKKNIPDIHGNERKAIQSLHYLLEIVRNIHG